MNLNDSDKAWLYQVFHVHEGRMYFGENDLQQTARFDRLGVVVLGQEEDGCVVYAATGRKGVAMKKRSEKWRELWLLRHKR